MPGSFFCTDQLRSAIGVRSDGWNTSRVHPYPLAQESEPLCQD